jgi:hypothetical protein
MLFFRYFAGHSDTLAGVLAVKSPEVWHKVTTLLFLLGMRLMLVAALEYPNIQRDGAGFP